MTDKINVATANDTQAQSKPHHLNISKTQKIFVLDTNVLVSDPVSIYGFQPHFVVIPMTVIIELDGLKDRRDKDDARRDARNAIRQIAKIINGHPADVIASGMPLYHDDDKNAAKLAICSDERSENNASDISADNAIINLALQLTKEYPDHKVVLVTKDVPMQIRGKAFGLLVEEYRNDVIAVADESELHSMIIRIPCEFSELDEQCAMDDDTSSHEKLKTPRYTYKSNELKKFLKELVGTHPDVLLNTTFIDNQSAARRCISVSNNTLVFNNIPLKQSIKELGDVLAPRNDEQALAMMDILDPSKSINILSGPAGSGKTLIALACACSLVERGMYDRIILTRPASDLEEPIGFLPGSEDEKMRPWMGGFMDALEVLFNSPNYGGGKLQEKDAKLVTLEFVINKYRIDFRSMNFMRGRSYQRTLIICDELQNANRHQAKTLCSRVGDSSKIILLGNINQIDNPYNSPQSNALSYIIEQMRFFDEASIITLPGGQRSRLATFAEQMK